MRLRDLLYETFTAIRANRVRSLLTILGIVIGIAAVIAMTALIDGIKMSLVGQLGLNQSRLVYIYCYPDTRQVTMDDLKQLELNVPDYEFVSATSFYSGKATNGTRSLDSAQIIGCDENYFTAVGSKLVSGRFLTADECTGSSMSVVIDQQVVTKLWGSSATDVVGQSIRINDDSYSVVGVVEAGGMNSQMIYMPYSTLTTRVSGYSSIDQIIGYAREDADMSTIGDKTKSFLIKYFDISEENQDLRGLHHYDEVDHGPARRHHGLVPASHDHRRGRVARCRRHRHHEHDAHERDRAHTRDRTAQGAGREKLRHHQAVPAESVMLCIVGGVFGILLGYGGAWALASVASGMAGIGQIVPIISPTAVAMATASACSSGWSSATVPRDAPPSSIRWSLFATSDAGTQGGAGDPKGDRDILGTSAKDPKYPCPPLGHLPPLGSRRHLVDRVMVFAPMPVSRSICRTESPVARSDTSAFTRRSRSNVFTSVGSTPPKALLATTPTSLSGTLFLPSKQWVISP